MNVPVSDGAVWFLYKMQMKATKSVRQYGCVKITANTTNQRLKEWMYCSVVFVCNTY